MSGQATRVLVLDNARGSALRRELDAADYEFRAVPHARFQAKGEGVTVTLYRSGKLVVQGHGIDGWALRYLGTEAPGPRQERELDLPLLAIGSDEAGKGDTFGPLVVCAVALPNGHAAKMAAAGVTDSKRVRDDRVRVLAAWIRTEVPYQEIVVEPEEYNHLHALHGDNVNRLLTELHAEVLLALHRRTRITEIVVDRFDASEPVTRALHRENPEVHVHEIPRGERHPAVAAASILARDRFLDSLDSLSERAAVDLPRGSGTPVPRALRRFLEIHDRDSLRRVAKLHFKNVQFLLDRRG